MSSHVRAASRKMTHTDTRFALSNFQVLDSIIHLLDSTTCVWEPRCAGFDQPPYRVGKCFSFAYMCIEGFIGEARALKCGRWCLRFATLDQCGRL